MLVCQWHLDVLYGKQAPALDVMRAWRKDITAGSEFQRAVGDSRVMVGAVGKSPGHIVTEHQFQSLGDFEAAVGSMATPQFRAHSDNLAPYVVGGSQHWVVYRLVE
jgi:hypothetical protein